MARRTSGTPEEPRFVSRKHISRAERETRRRRQIILGTVVLAAVITLLLAGGALYSALVEPNQRVAVVSGEQITRRDYQKRVNYERFRLFQTAEDSREQAEELMSDPQSAQFVAQFFEQQMGQLQQIYAGLGTQSLEAMIEDEIIENEAEARGITVTEEEIDEEIRRQMARIEGAQIEADVTATGVAAEAATATAELWTPTPTLEPSATATISGTTGAGDEDEEAVGEDEETDEESADEEETEAGEETDEETSEGEETDEGEEPEITETGELTPTATPEPTLTPLPTFTPNILSEEQYTTTYGNFLREMQRRAGFTEADFRNVIRAQLLREKLQEEIEAEAEVTPTEEQIRVAHILVATEEEAQQALERLEAGESFEALAAELSTDTSNAQTGGELEWFSRDDSLDPAFIEGAFALTEPDEVSEPVQSQFGWHLIRLLEGPEERERSEEEIEQERAEAFSEWLSSQRSGEEVQRFWSVDDVPRDPFEDEILEPLPTVPVQPTQEFIIPTPLEGDEGLEATPEAGAPTDDEAGEEEAVPALTPEVIEEDE